MEEKKHHTTWEQQWLEGKISSEEAAKNTVNPDFDAFEKFVESAKHLDVPRVTSKDAAWQKLENKISEQQHSPKVISISRRNWFIGVAASFILALGAFFLFPSPDKDLKNFATAMAESRVIFLPDSSAVHLNAASSVSLSEETWKKDRVLSLNGEAFFEVKRGSKFSVITDAGIVTVLGTSFNVRQRDGELIVACKTGKVGVSKSDNSGLITITPGQMVTITSNEIGEIQEVNNRRIASWINNEFEFESLPLKAVFEELERQYDIKVSCDFDEATLEEPMTATLPTDNLEEAVKTLELIKSIKATFSEDGQSISFMRK